MSNNHVDIEENLYGCYLLYCLNDKYRGHTYIGYTVNPLRRIKQHNKGIRAGGAKRTNNKGPWEMALLVHGFPNSVCALKFEWAWQNPNKSRRLKCVRSKRARETAFQYRVYVMSEMLQKGPWKRLPLTVRWLNPKYAIDFSPALCPPAHMPIVYGLVDAKKVSSTSSPDKKGPTSRSPVKNASSELDDRCSVCFTRIADDRNKMRCVNPKCTMVSHVTCLADRFCGGSSFIPIMGECPNCRLEVLWGDLIKHKNGCYQTLNAQDDDDDIWADLLKVE